MNLPTIQENKDLQQAVSARELYQFLEPTERFSNWFDRQVQYGFEEGVDYLGCKVFNTLAKQELQDYLMSVDMAKEVSMIQRSDKGKQARQYFIECEKKLSKQVFQLPDFTNPAEAARAFADQYEQKQIAMQKLAIAEPKAKALDVIDSSEGALNIRDTAKTLGVGQKKFIEWALRNEWLYRDSKNKLQAYSKRIQQGYMEIKAVTYNSNNYNQRATTQAVFTPRGLVRLSKIFSVINEVV